ncbi:hypothetical protein MLD52_11060 [Puniceicoccaceae bacterium K14]|nr:hypothetical protein [Puniceicoccaceae bacterium K14]
MPELAEVAFHSKAWLPAIGDVIEEVLFNADKRCCKSLVAERIQSDLVGESLEELHTHGKRMLFKFSGQCCLSVHLGMTGSLHCSSLPLSRSKFDHFTFCTKEGGFIFRDPRQFGKVELFVGEEIPEWWRLLPPEVLDLMFNFELFESYCERRKRRPLKAFLLLQECFPGVGNWMADEILWQSRLKPNRLVSALSSEERLQLFNSLKAVCRGAMDTVGVDYSDPPESWLFRHRWKPGGNCPQTGDPLARETIGGRTTCWSPSWQA